MSRREVIGAVSGVVAAAATGGAGRAAAAATLSTADGYYLSGTNPCATRDQHEVEDLALEIVRRPEMQQARERAAALWKLVTEYTAGPQMARFDQMINECTLNYALKGAVYDPDYPRIVRLLQAPGRWFGRDMPGSRWGGDNPDNCYRIAPVAHGARYEVHGQRMPGGVSNVSYAIVANTATSVTQALLDQREVATATDGSFVITIDDQPANGRSNHLQTQPGTLLLFVRDSMNDWGTETPNALRIRRLDPPTRAPLTLEERARFAAEHFVADVYLLYWFTRLNYGFPPDRMNAPRGSGGAGGLRSQLGSQGLIRLKDHEAMVVTTVDGGAAFRDFVLHDVWYLSIDYWQRQTSLCGGQMAADADGRYTFVIAHADPGVHNWLDTGGLHENFALHRWQGLPEGATLPTLPMSSRVVPLKDLAQALPRGVKTVSREERARLLAKRHQDFQRRFDV